MASVVSDPGGRRRIQFVAPDRSRKAIRLPETPTGKHVLLPRAIRYHILHMRLAERAGFEPAEGFYPLAALAKRCFRPLSHLSTGPD